MPPTNEGKAHTHTHTHAKSSKGSVDRALTILYSIGRQQHQDTGQLAIFLHKKHMS